MACRGTPIPVVVVLVVGGIRGFPKLRGTIFGVPIIRVSCRILGSILGSP